MRGCVQRYRRVLGPSVDAPPYRPAGVGHLTHRPNSGKDKYTAVSLGSTHACVLDNTGVVKCFGMDGLPDDRNDSPYRAAGEAYVQVDAGVQRARRGD